MGTFMKLNNVTFGIGTDVVMQFPGITGKLKSSFVGIKANKYLILETPQLLGIEAKIQGGGAVTIMYVCDGTVYGFRSTILHVLESPIELLFISFPETVESHDLRSTERVSCYLPAELAVDGDDIMYDGILLDISATGCRFNTGSMPRKKVGRVQVGTKVQLNSELFGIDGKTIFTGEVRNLTVDGSKLSLGVQFDEVDARVGRKIKKYVDDVVCFFAP